MWNWIARNKWKILLAVIAFAAGVFANYLANRASERRIITALTEQINALKNTRLTASQQQELLRLEAQLQLLTAK